MRMTPRWHHIMPDFYLNGFSSNGYLWVFDIQRQEFRKQPPRHTMVAIDHYTLKLKSGSKDLVVEEFFAFLESHIAPALVRLKKRHRAGPEDLGLIALLASNLFLRAPATEQRVTRGIEDKAAEFARARFGDEFFTKFGIEINRNWLLGESVKHTNTLATEFMAFEWQFCRAPKGHAFITSDNPVSATVTSAIEQPERGILSKDAIRVFPLSQELCLTMNQLGENVEYGMVTKDMVRGLNESTALSASRFIMSNSLELLKSICEKLERLRGERRI